MKKKSRDCEKFDELKKKEKFLFSVLENVPDMIFVKDAKDLKFEMFNKAGEKLLGYKHEEMIGKSDYDFFPKKQADFFIKKDRQVLKSGMLLDIPEEPIDTKNGKRFLHTKKIPIMEKGKPKYLMGISEDITEKKKVELEYKTIIESMNDGFYITDGNGEILAVNQAYSKMTGYSSKELLKKNVRHLEALQSAKEVGEHIKEIKVIGGGQFESKHKHKNGGAIDVEVSVTYLESGDRFFSFIRDISQRKKNERELQKRTEDLERFNRAAVGRELKMIELKKKIKRLEGGARR